MKSVSRSAIRSAITALVRSTTSLTSIEHRAMPQKIQHTCPVFKKEFQNVLKSVIDQN